MKSLLLNSVTHGYTGCSHAGYRLEPDLDEGCLQSCSLTHVNAIRTVVLNRDYCIVTTLYRIYYCQSFYANVASYRMVHLNCNFGAMIS